MDWKQIISAIADLDPFIIYTGGGPEACFDYARCGVPLGKDHATNCLWASAVRIKEGE